MALLSFDVDLDPNLLIRGQTRWYADRVTRQEIEQKMDELAREYHETHDSEIPEEILNWLGGFGGGNIERSTVLAVAIHLHSI